MLLHLWNIEHWQLRSYRLPSERGDRSGFARTVWPISYWKGTPPKTWIPKIAIFERRYILETIIFGIYVNFFAGVVWCSTILHPVFWFHLHSLLQEMLTFHIRYRWHLMAICASIYSIQMSRVEPLGFQNTMVMPFCAPQVMEPVRIALEAKRSSQCKPSKHRWWCSWMMTWWHVCLVDCSFSEWSLQKSQSKRIKDEDWTSLQRQTNESNPPGNFLYRMVIPRVRSGFTGGLNQQKSNKNQAWNLGQISARCKMGMDPLIHDDVPGQVVSGCIYYLINRCVYLYTHIVHILGRSSFDAMLQGVEFKPCVFFRAFWVQVNWRPCISTGFMTCLATQPQQNRNWVKMTKKQTHWQQRGVDWIALEWQVCWNVCSK